MDELIKLIRTYRLTAGLAERMTLSEQIIAPLVPDLWSFIFHRVAPDVADDIMQEILVAKHRRTR